MNINLAADIVSAVAFVLFVVLLTLSVARMVGRVRLYYSQGRKPSIILRRDIALLGSLLIVFGGLAAIRFFGWGAFLTEGLPRFLWIVFSDTVGIAGLAYWTYAEYEIIGREGKEDA